MSQMTKYRMPGIFLALLTSVAAMALPAGSVRPQLVIGIVIDGLDQQYVDLLRERFGRDGFNRLLNEGVVITDVDYGTNLDATAATAVLMTGTSPATNQIAGAEVYDRDRNLSFPAVLDPGAMGNFTNETFSPRALSVSTLADEVRISGGGVNRVFSIAASPTQAIVLGGHSANAALWLNAETGAWATSTFYKDLPTSVSHRNRLRPLSARLDTMQWTPLGRAEDYPGLPEHITHYPFRYVFPRGQAARYDMFAASPLANSEVTDLAGEIIADLKLGTTAEGPDMVSLAYTLKPYDYTKNQDNRYELIDTYLRLDRDLARLMTMADNQVGRGNALIFLAGTPPSSRSRRDDERWNIPYGEFSTKKAKSLLNMFLMAKYGNGEWVTAFNNDQFYLNHKLIDEQRLSAYEVRREAASFLEKMTGVDRVITADEILSGRGDSFLEALQRNTVASRSGDLFVEVSPGWETVDDISSQASPTRVKYVHRAQAPVGPMIIMAPGAEPRTITTPVDARAIAPTLARQLRIRSPNAARTPPVSL